MDDWLEKRAAIAAELTQRWFRLTAEEVNRRNPDRTPLLPEWIEVQRRFAEWCGRPGNQTLAPLPTERPNVDHLVKQCVGLLLTTLVHARRPVSSNDDFVHEGMSLLIDAVEQRELAQEFRRRTVDLGVADLFDNQHAGDRR